MTEQNRPDAIPSEEAQEAAPAVPTAPEPSFEEPTAHGVTASIPLWWDSEPRTEASELGSEGSGGEPVPTQSIDLGATTALPTAAGPADSWPAPAEPLAAPADPGPSPAEPAAYFPPPVPPAQPAPLSTARPPIRRGPGWAGVIGIALAMALIGGLLGGLLGAQLATRGSSAAPGQRSAVTPPTPGAGATSRATGTVANIAANALPGVVTLRVSSALGDATGSGWVYDSAGHIVTNNHVVDQAVGGQGTVVVVLENGKHLQGSVVGRSISYDLAVVKVDATGLTALPVGRSADVVVGDPVIAVGAPLGLDSTVTTGIVSALDRPVTPGEDNEQSYISAIQTDAAINPGNSGGPLLDMSGQVIGVTSAIARVPSSDGTGSNGNIGVGFAIPSDQVVRTVDQLISGGQAEHPIIGVFLDMRYEGEGVRVGTSGMSDAITPGGPAAKAGIKAGDVIVAIDGKPVESREQFIVKIRAHEVGDKVTLTIRRDNEPDAEVEVVLAGSTQG